MTNTEVGVEVRAIRLGLDNMAQGLMTVTESLANLTTIVVALHEACSQPDGPSPVAEAVERLASSVNLQTEALNELLNRIGGSDRILQAKWLEWWENLQSEFPSGVAAQDDRAILGWDLVMEFCPHPALSGETS